MGPDDNERCLIRCWGVAEFGQDGHGALITSQNDTPPSESITSSSSSSHVFWTGALDSLHAEAIEYSSCGSSHTIIVTGTQLLD